MESWSPAALAWQIEQEVEAARQRGYAKLTLHMDLPDALKLAASLRTARY